MGSTLELTTSCAWEKEREKLIIVSAQPISARHLCTVSMPSLHLSSSLQSAADTLVSPFSPFFTPLFVTPACTQRYTVMPACRQAVKIPYIYTGIHGHWGHCDCMTAYDCMTANDGYGGIHAGVMESGVKST